MEEFETILISVTNEKKQRENGDNCTLNGTTTSKNIIKKTNDINDTHSVFQETSKFQETAAVYSPKNVQSPSINQANDALIRIQNVNEKIYIFKNNNLNKNFNSENNIQFLRESKKSNNKFCSLEIIPQKRSTSTDITQESCLRLQSNEKDAGNASDEETETCWAWVVLFACIYNTMITTGFALAFGIQFGPIINEIGMSSTTVSWVFNLMGFMWNMTSSITSPLCRLLGWRTVGFWAALVAAVSFTLLSITRSSGYLVFFFSVVLGTAAGIGHQTTQIILPAYFTKRRGLAFGLLSTFMSVGQICTPLIIVLLLKQFGYLGSILLRGGMALNCCVTALLYRPLKSKPLYMKPICSTEDSSMQIVKSNTTLGILKQFLNEITCFMHQCMQALKTFTILINISSFCGFVVGFVNFSMLVPFAMISAGHSPQDAALALSCMAFSGCVARFMMSLVSDCRWFSKMRAYIAGTLVASAACFGFIFALPHLTWVLLVMGAWGVGIGFSISLRQPLLIETVGMAGYMPALGATGFVMAAAYGVIGPIFGVVRDATASYASSLAACASLQLCAGLVWLLQPRGERADARREEQTVVETADARREEQTVIETADASREEQTVVETADARREEQTVVETADARREEQTGEKEPLRNP